MMRGEAPWALAVGDNTELRGFRRPGDAERCGVFIHGFRSHCDGEKSRQLSTTAGLHRWPWLRFDQRGCGASDGEFRRFTVSGAVEDLNRVLVSIGAGSYILVGSSLGALIALHAARDARQPIDGLVLVAPALRFADRFIHDHLDERDLDDWRRRGYRWFPDLYGGGCYRLDYGFCADALRYREPPLTLPCPLRVLHGTRDELLPLDDTLEWTARVDSPGLGLEIVDGGDHRLSGWSEFIARQTESLWNETRHTCA